MINQLRSPFAALALPVLAGLAWMAWAGAPTSYLAVNAAALMLALAATRITWPRGATADLLIAAALTSLLCFTAYAGLEIDGVRRWLSVGPLRLHTGYLVLPLLVVLLARLEARWTLVITCAAAFAIASQPDLATAAGLAAASAVAALSKREQMRIGAALIAVAGLLAISFASDPLQPVRFVEAVQTDALTVNPLIGALLVLVTFTPLLLLPGGKRAAAPLATFMTAAGLMAFNGPYPSILIGYGAAPILGFGLALAALRAR